MGASEGTQTASLDRAYDGTTETLNAARLDLHDILAAHGHQDLVADAQLVLSELATNAVKASPGEPYRVLVTVDDDGVGVTVTNTSDASIPTRDKWTPDDVLAYQGRGLSIVRALSESVEISRDGRKTSVQARLRIAAD